MRDNRALGKQGRNALRGQNPPRNGTKKLIADLQKDVDSGLPAGDTPPQGADAPRHDHPVQSRTIITTKRTTRMGSDTGIATTTSKRARNILYTYRDEEGAVSDKFGKGSRSVIFKVAATGETLEFAFSELFGDQPIPTVPENVILATLFGLKTTVGNSVTGVGDDEGPEAYLEALTDRKTTIVDGEWREGGQRGPSTRLVLEAMIAWATDKKGSAPGPKTVSNFEALIKEKGTKAALANKELAPYYEEVKLREQQKRLEKARAAAAATPAETAEEGALGELFAD